MNQTEREKQVAIAFSKFLLEYYNSKRQDSSYEAFTETQAFKSIPQPDEFYLSNIERIAVDIKPGSDDWNRLTKLGWKYPCVNDLPQPEPSIPFSVVKARIEELTTKIIRLGRFPDTEIAIADCYVLKTELEKLLP